MSSPPEDTELKGGHAPAVKAGGMRITQHKHAGHEKPAPVEVKEVKPEEGEEGEEELEEVTPSPPKQVLISGAPARGDADFPTAAVQAIHNKPAPAHEYRPAASRPQIIHQPRK